MLLTGSIILITGVMITAIALWRSQVDFGDSATYSKSTAIWMTTSWGGSSRSCRKARIPSWVFGST